MKTRECLIPLICSLLLPFAGIAQCGTTHTLSYDSTVNGIGDTETPYNLTFPEFNSSMGTLVDVKIISVLTITYKYDIENTAASAKTIKLRINREDEITSSALSDPIDNDYSIPASPSWITHNLAGSDGVTGSGPDFVSVPPFDLANQDTIINESAANPADFFGSGQVSFDYSSYTSLTSSPLGVANITNTATTDQIKFILQYTYCDNILLASGITSFSAAKKDDYVSLNWITGNEIPDRNYELQKSYDGQNFVPVVTVPSNPGINQAGNYNYDYVPLPNETGKLYFRIKEIESGVTAYSPVRMVDFGEVTNSNSGIRLVPNPSNGRFSVEMINNMVANDWNIDLFNINGQVIREKQAPNTTLAKFPMNETLSSGVYFVIVTNKRNNQKFVERLIVN